MKLRLKRSANGDEGINVGPFADIAFLMIIFFILTTEFVKPAGDTMKIPSGTTEAAKKTDKQLTVNLKQDEIRYGEKGQAVALDELKGLLLAEKLLDKAEDERIVILDSAPDVGYERYFQVVMAINDAGGVLALIDHSGGSK